MGSARKGPWSNMLPYWFLAISPLACDHYQEGASRSQPHRPGWGCPGLWAQSCWPTLHRTSFSSPPTLPSGSPAQASPGRSWPYQGHRRSGSLISCSGCVLSPASDPTSQGPLRQKTVGQKTWGPGEKVVKCGTWNFHSEQL